MHQEGFSSSLLTITVILLIWDMQYIQELEDEINKLNP